MPSIQGYIYVTRYMQGWELSGVAMESPLMEQWCHTAGWCREPVLWGRRESGEGPVCFFPTLQHHPLKLLPTGVPRIEVEGNWSIFKCLGTNTTVMHWHDCPLFCPPIVVISHLVPTKYNHWPFVVHGHKCQFIALIAMLAYVLLHLPCTNPFTVLSVWMLSEIQTICFGDNIFII